MSDVHKPRINAYTATSNVRQSELIVRARVCGEIDTTGDPSEMGKTIADTAKEYVGIWDTGAVLSSVSELVANELHLPTVEFKVITAVSGQVACAVHMATIMLPGGIILPNMKVTSLPLTGEDFIFGMDVIGLGDFAITHFSGVTKYSFQIPSTHDIDFVKEAGGGDSPPTVFTK